MAGDEDYYDDDLTFKGYKVTSVNPGVKLLAITIAYAVCCILLGWLLKCRMKKKERGEESDDLYHQMVDSIMVDRTNTGSTKTDNSGGASALTGEDDFYESNPSIEVMDPAVSNAIGHGLLDLGAVESSFDFVFVGRGSSNVGRRRPRLHPLRKNDSRHRSLSSIGSQHSFASISLQNSSLSHLSSNEELESQNAINMLITDQVEGGTTNPITTNQVDGGTTNPITTMKKAEEGLTVPSYRKTVDNPNATVSTMTTKPNNGLTLKTEIKHMYKLAGP